MSRNRNGSGVRGPNSALTAFLRNEGITEGFRRRREAQSETPEIEEVPEATEEEPVVVVRGRNRRAAVSETPDEEEQAIRAAGRRKRRGGAESDSDFDPDFEDEELSGNAMKKFGEEDTCVDCGKIFNLTVYSRYLKNKKGYICENCNEALKQKERNTKRNQAAARKKRKKVASALLDKKTVRIPKLQDICISKITQNIGDVDALGDIGQLNMNKISRILSKNRSLNDSTLSLFLNPGLKSLEFWDCSNVDSDSLNKIASYCPDLESLTLFMCGQLHNDNLKYYATNLPKLTSLSLNGPFLISDLMWREYFEDVGPRLSRFEIRNTHRFENDSLISLLETSGKNLTSLKLSRLDGLDSEAVYDLIPHYLEPSKLEHLEISYPYKENLISDDLIINILSITGESLISLNVDGCSNLTGRFLIDGIGKFCPNLTHLSMQNLDQVTDEDFSLAFSDYISINTGGLISVNLTKCSGLGNNAIYALLKHSSQTLVELSINSLFKLTKEFLLQIFTDEYHPYKKILKEKIENQTEEDEVEEALQYYEQCNFPFLTTADMGFVRAVDDEVLALIGEGCPKLSVLEVYGDNRCTFRAKIRKDLLVIGRQGDEV